MCHTHWFFFIPNTTPDMTPILSTLLLSNPPFLTYVLNTIPNTTPMKQSFSMPPSIFLHHPKCLTCEATNSTYLTLKFSLSLSISLEDKSIHNASWCIMDDRYYLTFMQSPLYNPLLYHPFSQQWWWLVKWQALIQWAAVIQPLHHLPQSMMHARFWKDWCPQSPLTPKKQRLLLLPCRQAW